ncbi:DUF4190 domain-containing protein [Gordonia sp. CPCC 205333]|uniref:DUF4190 domain-containing protein n=1 Tax=Gordonia sp. CPCC 205333 TaxID=3140790 RepID=UPI003AF39A3D
MSPDHPPETTQFPPRPSTLPHAYSALPDDGPLPAVGDFWDLNHPDPLPSPPITPTAISPVPQARRIVTTASFVPSVLPMKTAPAVSWAFAAALSSIPLLVLCGLGAILGVVAVVLGIVGVAQVNSSDRYRGTGRAAASIAIGLSTTLVGTLLMLLTMALFGA